MVLLRCRRLELLPELHANGPRLIGHIVYCDRAALGDIAFCVSVQDGALVEGIVHVYLEMNTFHFAPRREVGNGVRRFITKNRLRRGTQIYSPRTHVDGGPLDVSL